MQMKVPVVSMNRKPLEHTDLPPPPHLPFHCVGCDQTVPREQNAPLSGSKEAASLFHNLLCFVHLLHIKDKHRGRAVDRVGNEATNERRGGETGLAT